MNNKPIVIRSAQADDYTNVWRLLHSEGRDTEFAECMTESGHLYVLLHGDKLIAILHTCGSNCSGDVVVHPLYSQGLVEDIMAKAVNGLLFRILL